MACRGTKSDIISVHNVEKTGVICQLRLLTKLFKYLIRKQFIESEQYYDFF